MKVYVHFEDPHSPEYTKRVTLKDLDPASKIVAEFVSSYNNEYGNGMMSVESISLKSSTGKVFDLSKPLTGIKDKSDIYVSISPQAVSERVSILPDEVSSKAAEDVSKNDSTPLASKTRSFELKAKKLEEACHFKDARISWEDILASDETNITALLSLGKLAARKKDHEQAATYFRRVKTLSDGPESIETAEALLGLGNAQTCLGCLQEAASTYESLLLRSDEIGVDAKVGMARVLMTAGHAQQAADLIMNALAPPNSEHVEGLLMYATIAEQHEKNEEALSVLLRLVVSNKDNSSVKKLLAKVLAKESQLGLLQSIVPLSSASSSAYAFLATVVKDHGEIDISCELLRLAYSQSPQNHSYALNYVHGLELLGSLSVAWDALLAHLAANSQVSIGGVSNADFLAAAADARSDKDWTVNWVTQGEPYATCTAPGHTVKDVISAVVLSDPELDVLALWLCAVKIRYLMGGSVLSLVACVEPARRSSSLPLHSTTIRNEHAYYCCIAQIKAASPAESYDINKECETLYVCGDSHCLSPAWQKLRLAEGKSWILEPKLVTGLKHWHLRPEGDFYPKVNFERVVRSIPDKSNVVFIFGEIDCREGILMAVQKDRYSSVEEGMSITLSYYISELNKLASERRFTIMVHPIVPVLNETRSLVMHYNKLLRNAVLKSSSLRWLGGPEDCLFQGLLDGDKLLPEFALDGTHLNPAYVRLLSPAIQAALSDPN